MHPTIDALPQAEKQMYIQLLGPDLVPFLELMRSMTFSIGSERSDAENHFKAACFFDPDTICMKLLPLIRSANQTEVRVKAVSCLAFVLRRNPEVYLWSRLEPFVQCRLKARLLSYITTEQARGVLEKLRIAVIELGTNLLPDSWPELIHFIGGSILSTSLRAQESGLFIFSYLVGFIQRSKLPPLHKLHSVIRDCLCNQDPCVQDVRKAALLAACSLIYIEQDREQLQDLLPSMITVLRESVTSNQHEFAIKVIKRFTCLIAVESKFICPYVEAMLDIAEQQEELRHEAVNLVVTLAKTREKEPGTANLMLSYILFSCCINSVGIAYHRLISLTT